MLNKNIVNLVNKLACEYGLNEKNVMDDVLKKESKLYNERFYLKDPVSPMKTSYFYSAIGRVRDNYRFDLLNQYLKF